MKKLSLATLLFAAIALAPSAHAGGKAYQFTFDKKMSEEACTKKMYEVAAENRLAPQAKESNGDIGLNNEDDERAGVAYHSEGVCHIYIF